MPVDRTQALAAGVDFGTLIRCGLVPTSAETAPNQFAERLRWNAAYRRLAHSLPGHG